jgi:hypothetical protein
MGKLLHVGKDVSARVAAFFEEIFPRGRRVVPLLGISNHLIEMILASSLGFRGPPWIVVVYQLVTVEDKGWHRTQMSWHRDRCGRRKGRRDG